MNFTNRKKSRRNTKLSKKCLLEVNNFNIPANDPEYLRFIGNLFLLSSDIFVPDFVLKAKLKHISKLPGLPSFFDLASGDNAELQRLNF
jgi:hypothetical protein